MAKPRKDPSGEIQSMRIAFNVTPTLYRNYQALVKLSGRNSNELLTAIVEGVIRANQSAVDKVIAADEAAAKIVQQVRAEYEQLTLPGFENFEQKK